VRALTRGEAVVCIPVFGALDLFDACLASVLEHTDPGVPVVVADDATPGEGVAERVAAAAGRDVRHLRQPENRGFVENVNAALRATAPADVAVVNSDCVVTEGWLDGLLAAAASDSRVATASAMADSATIASVPAEGEPDAVAAAIRAQSLRLRPRLPTAIGHCFLVRRVALDLVGLLDPAFSPGYGEEVDFSQRCLAHGMLHVLADDVWVRHRGEGSFSGRAAALREDHERLVERRYPWYPGMVRRAPEGPLGDALGAALRALRPLTVTVDGSALGPQTMGTQVTTLELVRALARRDDLRVRLALPPEPGDLVSQLDVETVRVGAPAERSDVVHRPAQVVAPVNLDWLRRLGERIVITHQDLIAWANPAYFESFAAWDGYRALARRSLAAADAAVFITDYVRREALAEGLVTADRAVVVPQGVDRPLPEPARPAGAPDPGFLLLLGADFRHKNRAFGLRLARALAGRGWNGRLVLAGPHMRHGSSRAEEDELLAANPDLSARTVRLEELSQAEVSWLYANAALVLYPTLSEGFGLVPFEAAAAGTACMFAPVSSLPEVLDPADATIVPWDVEASADRALELLSDEASRRRLAESVAGRGRRYTWDGTAARLVDLYREVLRRPRRAGGDVAAGAQSELDAHLPPDVRRALLAISTRPALRGPAFAALRASYRALRRGRRAR
jgi:glycosyltransferase involved in cell wall biosynthesis